MLTDEDIKQELYMNKNIEHYEEIDLINIELGKMIYCAKHSLDIYLLIADNATKLKKSGASKLWSYFQRLVLNDISINICNIFNNPKVVGYYQNNIKRIIEVIRNNNVNPKCAVGLEEFIKRYSEYLGINTNGVSGDEFISLSEKFIIKNKDSLKQIKTFRDEKLAHNDKKSQVLTTASINDMVALTNFAIDFYKTIYDAFIGNVMPHDFHNDTRIKHSLSKIFTRLGYIS